MPARGQFLPMEERLLRLSMPEPNSGCWIWIGKRAERRGGYGVLNVGSKPIKWLKASRASYIAFKGPLPDDKDACHRCDLPPCINPDHLFPGTHAENMADMCKKGRHPNSRKTHCRNGHPLVSHGGRRMCLVCSALSLRARAPALNARLRARRAAMRAAQ